MFANISAYLKSVECPDSRDILPRESITAQIIDLIRRFSNSKMKDIGLFQYIQNVYHKKYKKTHNARLSLLFRSLLKSSKMNRQIAWFSQRIEDNERYLVMTSINSAITELKRRFPELFTKGEDHFLRRRMSADITLDSLNRIFKSKVPSYETLNSETLIHRMKRYMLDIQPDVLKETSAIEFLEIVRRESLLVIDVLNGLNLVGESILGVIDQSAKKRQIEDVLQSYQQSQRHKHFYNMDDLMGVNDLELPEGYIESCQRSHQYKNILTERKEPQLNEGGDKFEEENLDYAPEAKEETFDDLYAKIKDRKLDQQLSEFVKNVRDMELKSKEIKKEFARMPFSYEIIVMEHRKIRRLIEDRYEKLLFMKHMVHKIQNHEAVVFNNNPQDSLVDKKFVQELEEMEYYYRNFKGDLAQMIFGDFKIERYSLSDYFESCKKSKFVNEKIEEIPDDKKSASSKPLERIQRNSIYLDRLKLRADGKNGSEGSVSSRDSPTLKKVSEPLEFELDFSPEPPLSRFHSKVKDVDSENLEESHLETSQRRLVGRRKPKAKATILVSDLSKQRYEKHIYNPKKRIYYIAKSTALATNKDEFSIKQGDVLCGVFWKGQYVLVYKEDLPQKFGFVLRENLNKM